MLKEKKTGTECYQKVCHQGTGFATLEKLQILDTVCFPNLETTSKLTLLSIQILHKLLSSIS